MKKGALALIVQLAASAALSYAALLLMPVGWLYGLLIWGALPLSAFISALLLARLGLNPYICWLIPPLALTVISLVTMGYVAGGAAVLLTAFLGVVGAAAGDTLNKYHRKGRK